MCKNRSWLKIAGFSVLLGTAAVTGCSGPESTATTEIVAILQDRVPDGPDDAVWDRVPHHSAELLLQDMVEPRLLEASTPEVEVRAVSDGRRIAFKLTWEDATQNDLPGASRFVDACAVQLPVASAPNVPAPQMGEAEHGVEIAYWRASWQAIVDGRADEIRSLYPNATIDHYPFAAESLEAGSDEQRALERQYAPARALGHAMEGPRERPVEDLLAQGPGTLTPMAEQRSEASGRRATGGWEVVIVRPLAGDLGPGQRTQVAVAVWDGAHEEVGARKMRSGWIPLTMRKAG